jgi:spermidine/putrescine transport system ATP-binding protein
VLDVRAIEKSFASPTGSPLRALAQVSLSLPTGQFLCLLGPSGCGKTTLLRLIAGLEQADAGEIWIDGDRVDLLPPQMRPVHTVFQSYALFPHLSVFENVAFGLRLRRLDSAEIKRAANEALDLVNLAHQSQQMPSTLSGGQQQRVALARALVLKPKILLLDEPLSALDPHLRQQMRAELKRIQRQVGISFVMVTHDRDDTFSLADMALVLRDGHALQIDSPEGLYHRPAHPFVAEFLAGGRSLNPNILRKSGLGGVDTIAIPTDCDRIFVRPDAIELMAPRGGPQKTAQFGASVVSCTFDSGMWRVSLKVTDSGDELVTWALPKRAPQVGSSVSLSIRPDGCFAFRGNEPLALSPT